MNENQNKYIKEQYKVLADLNGRSALVIETSSGEIQAVKATDYYAYVHPITRLKTKEGKFVFPPNEREIYEKLAGSKILKENFKSLNEATEYVNNFSKNLKEDTLKKSQGSSASTKNPEQMDFNTALQALKNKIIILEAEATRAKNIGTESLFGNFQNKYTEHLKDTFDALKVLLEANKNNSKYQQELKNVFYELAELNVKNAHEDTVHQEQERIDNTNKRTIQEVNKYLGTSYDVDFLVNNAKYLFNTLTDKIADTSLETNQNLKETLEYLITTHKVRAPKEVLKADIEFIDKLFEKAVTEEKFSRIQADDALANKDVSRNADGTVNPPDSSGNADSKTVSKKRKSAKEENAEQIKKGADEPRPLELKHEPGSVGEQVQEQLKDTSKTNNTLDKIGSDQVEPDSSKTESLLEKTRKRQNLADVTSRLKGKQVVLNVLENSQEITRTLTINNVQRIGDTTFVSFNETEAADKISLEDLKRRRFFNPGYEQNREVQDILSTARPKAGPTSTLQQLAGVINNPDYIFKDVFKPKPGWNQRGRAFAAKKRAVEQKISGRTTIGVVGSGQGAYFDFDGLSVEVNRGIHQTGVNLLTEYIIEQTKARGPLEFVTSTNSGFDLMFAEAALRAKSLGHNVSLTLILPHLNYINKDTKAGSAKYQQSIINRADKVEVLRERRTRGMGPEGYIPRTAAFYASSNESGEYLVDHQLKRTDTEAAILRRTTELITGSDSNDLARRVELQALKAGRTITPVGLSFKSAIETFKTKVGEVSDPTADIISNIVGAVTKSERVRPTTEFTRNLENVEVDPSLIKPIKTVVVRESKTGIIPAVEKPSEALGGVESSIPQTNSLVEQTAVVPKAEQTAPVQPGKDYYDSIRSSEEEFYSGTRTSSTPTKTASRTSAAPVGDLLTVQSEEEFYSGTRTSSTPAKTVPRTSRVPGGDLLTVQSEEEFYSGTRTSSTPKTKEAVPSSELDFQSEEEFYSGTRTENVLRTTPVKTDRQRRLERWAINQKNFEESVKRQKELFAKWNVNQENFERSLSHWNNKQKYLEYKLEHNVKRWDRAVKYLTEDTRRSSDPVTRDAILGIREDILAATKELRKTTKGRELARTAAKQLNRSTNLTELVDKAKEDLQSWEESLLQFARKEKDLKNKEDVEEFSKKALELQHKLDSLELLAPKHKSVLELKESQERAKIKAEEETQRVIKEEREKLEDKVLNEDRIEEAHRDYMRRQVLEGIQKSKTESTRDVSEKRIEKRIKERMLIEKQRFEGEAAKVDTRTKEDIVNEQLRNGRLTSNMLPKDTRVENFFDKSTGSLTANIESAEVVHPDVLSELVRQAQSANVAVFNRGVQLTNFENSQVTNKIELNVHTNLGRISLDIEDSKTPLENIDNAINDPTVVTENSKTTNTPATQDPEVLEIKKRTAEFIKQNQEAYDRGVFTQTEHTGLGSQAYELIPQEQLDNYVEAETESGETLLFPAKEVRAPKPKRVRKKTTKSVAETVAEIVEEPVQRSVTESVAKLVTDTIEATKTAIKRGRKKLVETAAESVEETLAETAEVTKTTAKRGRKKTVETTVEDVLEQEPPTEAVIDSVMPEETPRTDLVPTKARKKKKGRDVAVETETSQQVRDEFGLEAITLGKKAERAEKQRIRRIKRSKAIMEEVKSQVEINEELRTSSTRKLKVNEEQLSLFTPEQMKTFSDQGKAQKASKTHMLSGLGIMSAGMALQEFILANPAQAQETTTARATSAALTGIVGSSPIGIAMLSSRHRPTQEEVNELPHSMAVMGTSIATGHAAEALAYRAATSGFKIGRAKIGGFGFSERTGRIAGSAANIGGWIAIAIASQLGLFDKFKEMAQGIKDKVTGYTGDYATEPYSDPSTIQNPAAEDSEAVFQDEDGNTLEIDDDYEQTDFSFIYGEEEDYEPLPTEVTAE